MEADGGGTVTIPAEECTHSAKIKIPDGINLIGAGPGQTVIHNADITISTRFYGNLNKGFRVSGMSLLGNSKLMLDTVHDFRVDNITLETSSGAGISVSSSHSGVIDQSTITVKGAFYGIAITGSTDPAFWEEDIS